MERTRVVHSAVLTWCWSPREPLIISLHWNPEGGSNTINTTPLKQRRWMCQREWAQGGQKQNTAFFCGLLHGLAPEGVTQIKSLSSHFKWSYQEKSLKEVPSCMDNHGYQMLSHWHSELVSTKARLNWGHYGEPYIQKNFREGTDLYL